MLSNKFSKLLIFMLLLFLARQINAQPVLFEQPLSPRIANYDINVKLNIENRTLHGKEKLTWHNKTQDRITELQFHLYLNAFRNTKSTFMIESDGSHRGHKIDEEGWGYIEVNKITLPSGQDLTTQMEFIHPDNDDADDKTVFRLPLSRPILPGGSIVLNIDYTAKLPEPPFARTGAKEEYFFVGQWFPKIGVYIDGKWNCHQFHRNSEFFADFGVYNVHITVPKKNIVGATGIEVEVKDNGDGTTTHFYHAEDVHDFAWTTSPEFIEVKGKSQDVDIRVLMQPDYKGQGQRHLDAAKVAVEYFQNWYGDYPYPNLTVVDPRRGAGGSAGMEYPTLITAGTFYGLPKGLRMVEMVIIHEFGHNFWYHLVANNEFEEAWLDEGINSYSESQIFADHYGPTGDIIDVWGIKINDQQAQRAQYIAFPDLDPIVQNSWNYYSYSSYGINSYQKPALMLTTLQNYLGKETMQNIMRTYFERWKFKHPKTQDFVDVANEVSGQDLNWFFEQALYSTAVVDYGVDRIIIREIKKEKGYDFTLSVLEDDTTTTDTTGIAITEDSISQALETGSISVEVDTADTAEAEKEQKIYYSEVKIRRLGSFKFPVEIEVIFNNGEKIREQWDGQDLWKNFRYVKQAKLVSATVDPDNKIPIDINFTNNSRTVKKQAKGVNKLAIRFLFWMQFLLDQPEFLNLFTGMGISL
jgi:hypothetical protein